MADLGKKISWKASLAKGEKPKLQDPAEVFLSFMNFCEAKIPSTKLKKECERFDEQRKLIKSEYKKFISEIAKEPFIASFVVWVKEVGQQDTEQFEGATMLLKNGLICVVGDDGKQWTIENAKVFDHRIVIDTIRCHREWPLHQRENVVKTYLSFLSWLSAETFSYIARFEDPDQVRTRGRMLPYPAFISFLSALSNDKARLVASLLYYGGSRSLDEVLQLTLKDVDFKNRIIQFKSASVSYPEHVFADVKAIAQSRTSGKLFLGRQKSPLNPAIIFRNFKEAALNSVLGNLFTPAYLTAGQRSLYRTSLKYS